MENKKKMAFNVVFLILVFAGTIYGVFHGEDLGEIARILKTVNLLWLIPGFICVIVFIRIVPKKKNALESRLIRCVISSVSG